MPIPSPRRGRAVALACAACASFFAASTPAYADVLAAAYDLQFVGYSDGHGSASNSLVGSTNVGRFAATIRAVGDAGADAMPFLTYCTDLYQSFAWNRTYRYTTAATGTAQGFTDAQADSIARLYSLAGRDVDSRDESVAFQLAVWESMYETSPGPGSLRGGRFSATGATAAQLDLADVWLARAASYTAVPTVEAIRLHSPTQQDMVMFVARVPPAGGPVPEPPATALVAAALGALGLGALSRRRTARARAR